MLASRRSTKLTPVGDAEGPGAQQRPLGPGLVGLHLVHLVAVGGGACAAASVPGDGQRIKVLLVADNGHGMHQRHVGGVDDGLAQQAVGQVQLDLADQAVQVGRQDPLARARPRPARKGWTAAAGAAPARC